MPAIYNVHIYREMRLVFPGIEAGSHEDAARIASARATEEAARIEPCDGQDLGALVDIAGDEDFRHSKSVDFEPERLRRAAGKLLEALRTIAATPLWGEAIADPALRADYIETAQYDRDEDSFEPSCDTESSMLQDAVEAARGALEACALTGVGNDA